MRVAFIITGDVRDCSVRKTLPSKVASCDVFCGSYSEHGEYLKEFGNTNVIINKLDITPPFGLGKNDMQQNMLQWLCLHQVIKKYKDQLSQYDVICKIRFDTILHDWGDYNSFIKSCNIKEKTIHNHSDLVFFGYSDVFLKAFTDFYDVVIPNTYIVRNVYSNENSWKSEIEFRNNLVKHQINNIRIQDQVKISIDRGNYKKVTWDGNRKLYSECGELLGKFTKC